MDLFLERVDRVLKVLALRDGRLCPDLAGATVLLASRSSDYVSGAVLNADGGWLDR